ncbi:MAG: polysaccharide deacetylase family protein [Bacteroidales bacterium]|nr:polysaccharide deacetylase family protein [Bacteroidales bacterium]
MLLVYVPKLTNRLGYTLNVLLKHVLRIDFSITVNEADYQAFDGMRLCYGPHRVGDTLHIKNCDLLFETSINDQEPRPFERDGQWRLFPVYGRDLDFDFDMFAATFYMVSRYEEYLPHREDAHGRFMPQDSLAGRAGFLHQPVVDHWACMLRDALQQRYPDADMPKRSYRFVQTVDIDAAWCFLHKGLFRTVTGTLRDAFWRRDWDDVRRRYRVLFGKERDPFDTFDYIIDHNERSSNTYLIFFSLLADYGQYDKPASFHNAQHRDLLQHLGDHAKIGIHPGYGSLENPEAVDVEMRRLEEILHRPIVRARYHFLRLRLPDSYRILVHAGIRHDYTMGFADAIGFRAGISVHYPFYDLERDMESQLTVHPFCVMDTTMQKYLKLSPDEAIKEYHRLIDTVRRVDGVFCCIVHNQNLGELYGWQGWRRVYEDMVAYAKPVNP